MYQLMFFSLNPTINKNLSYLILSYLFLSYLSSVFVIIRPWPTGMTSLTKTHLPLVPHIYASVNRVKHWFR